MRQVVAIAAVAERASGTLVWSGVERREMTQPQDAALLAALEAQELRLSTALHRLEAARLDLVPLPADFWRGSARHTYDTAVENIGATADAGVAALRSARDRTSAAIAVVADRG